MKKPLQSINGTRALKELDAVQTLFTPEAHGLDMKISELKRRTELRLVPPGNTELPTPAQLSAENISPQ